MHRSSIDSIVKRKQLTNKTNKDMKKIYEWALKQINVSDSIVYAISMLRPEHAERFIEVSVGCEVNDYDVPQEFIYEGKSYKLVRCNYVLDQIIYTTMDTSERWFSTEEDANEYSKNGNYHWNTSSSSKSEQYPIKGEWTRECEHETYYERWFCWANVKM